MKDDIVDSDSRKLDETKLWMNTWKYFGDAQGLVSREDIVGEEHLNSKSKIINIYISMYRNKVHYMTSEFLKWECNCFQILNMEN